MSTMYNDDKIFNKEIKKKVKGNLHNLTNIETSISGEYHKSYNSDGIKKLMIKQFIYGSMITLSIGIILLLSILLKIRDSEIYRLNLLLDKSITNTVETKSELSSINSTNQKLIKEINLVTKLNHEYDKENDRINKMLSEYQLRTNLYDEYEYALINYNGRRTDLYYQELKTLINESNSRHINPHLTLCLIGLESGYIRNSSNNKSSALGYGNILNSTGDYIYSNILKMSGKYEHEKMALDGEMNIKMTIGYLDYLLKKYNGDVRKSLVAYNGNEIGTLYYELIEGRLETNANTTLDKIESEYKKYL